MLMQVRHHTTLVLWAPVLLWSPQFSSSCQYLAHQNSLAAGLQGRF